MMNHVSTIALLLVMTLHPTNVGGARRDTDHIRRGH
jgi:hypothetical protein